MKRLTVQFTDDVWKIIKGVRLSETDSEKIRIIVLLWLAQNDYLKCQVKRNSK